MSAPVYLAGISVLCVFVGFVVKPLCNSSNMHIISQFHEISLVGMKPLVRHLLDFSVFDDIS